MTGLDLVGPRSASSELAIVAVDVSKRFRLYRDRPTTLKERFVHFKGSTYEDFWALRGVSLEVPKGSTFGLIGHNGSGKSTLLRLMAGIHRPTAGRIIADGRVSALLELGAGFHPELSGRDNIYLNGSILGLSRREINAKMDEITDFAGLGEFLDSPVKVYSSGMFVRLGFAVAVHVNPRILLVDEIVAVGDEEFQRRCFDYLHRLKTNGVTIVLVSHSLNLIQTMCDRAAWLDHGALRWTGNAADVVHHYLDHVNAEEAQRLQHEVRTSASSASDGYSDAEGTVGQVTIQGVEFLNADGQSTPVAISNRPLTVRIHWSCREPVEEPLVSFAVESESGVYVANPGMRATHEPGPTLLGDGYVDYSIPALALGPGEYAFTVAVHDHDGISVLDRKDRLASLRVQRGTEIFAGLMDLLGTWQPLVARAQTAPQSSNIGLAR